MTKFKRGCNVCIDTNNTDLLNYYSEHLELLQKSFSTNKFIISYYKKTPIRMYSHPDRLLINMVKLVNTTNGKTVYTYTHWLKLYISCIIYD